MKMNVGVSVQFGTACINSEYLKYMTQKMSKTRVAKTLQEKWYSRVMFVPFAGKVVLTYPISSNGKFHAY